MTCFAFTSVLHVLLLNIARLSKLLNQFSPLAFSLSSFGVLDKDKIEMWVVYIEVPVYPIVNCGRELWRMVVMP